MNVPPLDPPRIESPVVCDSVNVPLVFVDIKTCNRMFVPASVSLTEMALLLAVLKTSVVSWIVDCAGGNV